MTIDDIIDAIKSSKTNLLELNIPKKPGVYAIFANKKVHIPNIKMHDHQIIFIGISDNLFDRIYGMHFSSENTGFSTLRRSLGALFKDEFKLYAIPRAPGKSKTNYTNYRFDESGESKLTDWMNKNLKVGFHSTNLQLEKLEDLLIKNLEPPINLTKWKNPDAKELKRLRKICADEARGL